MQSIRTHANHTMILLLVVIAGLLAHRSVANLMLTPAAPAVVATVDLEAVFNRLDQWSTAEMELKDQAERLDAEAQAIRVEVNQLNEDLETVYVPGTDEYNAALDQATMKAMRFQATIESAKRKLGRARSARLRATYEAVKTAAKGMAEEQGLDLVFVDDSRVRLPDGALSEADMTREISARRMLYTSPQLDMTEELVMRMNETFQSASSP